MLLFTQCIISVIQCAYMELVMLGRLK